MVVFRALIAFSYFIFFIIQKEKITLSHHYVDKFRITFLYYVLVSEIL